MKKVAFVLEKDDPRLPIHQNSIDGYNQKKIKTITTKYFFSKTTTKKSECKNLNIVMKLYAQKLNSKIQKKNSTFR